MESTAPKPITNLAEINGENQLIFDTVLESTMAGYWDWNIPEDSEYLSPGFKAMFGYKDHEMANHPSSWQKIIHQDDLPKVFAIFEKHVASKGEIPFDNEVRYYHKDGHIIWVLCKGKVIEWTEKGDPIRMIGCHIDVTDSKNRETLYLKQKNSLSKTIKKYAEMAHNVKLKDQLFKEAREISQFGIWSFDLITKKIEWSDETYQIFGFNKDEEISYEKYMSAIHPDYRDYLAKETERAIISGEKIEIDHPLITPTGEKKYVLATSKVINNDKGEPIAIRGAIQDITSRKEAEHSLAKYQKGLEILNEIAANINLDYEDQINEALKRVCKYLNLPLGILSKIEGSKYQIEFSHTSDPNLTIEKGALFDLGDTYCSIVIKDNCTVAIPFMGNSEYAAHPCYNHFKLETYIGTPVKVNGEIYGTINFSSPLEQKKNFSKYDKQFITMLANWVGSTFTRKLNKEELIEAKKKAEDASIAKEQFLSTMSHEIRTPMNAVIGISHLLLQENPQPYQLEKLKTLRFSAENLLALINDILDFNKIESGMIAFEQIDFNLSDLLNGVKHALKFKAQEKNLKLKVKYDNDIPEVVVGDPTRLTQVLINLIGNAIKFTEKGTVTVDVEATEETNKDVSICFTVTDTGIGIPKEKLPVIFERFSQANGDTTRKFGGSGLGLSIIKNLLELQESEICVESEVDKGSKFYFTLTFKKSQKTTVHDNTGLLIDHDKKDLQNVKILVVEDNKINQMVANEFLSKWKADITFAENGIIALEELKTKQFDIILMDLQMPEMDGYEATFEIRKNKNEQIKNLPIIALTASVMIEVKEKVQKSGFNDYVSKPFNPNELYLKIKRLVGKNKIVANKAEQVAQTPISFKKLDILAEGNTEFKKAVIAQLGKDAEGFKTDFVKGIINKNSQDISFAVHRFQTSLELFELNDIKTQIAQIRELIKIKHSEEELNTLLNALKQSLDKLK